MIKESRIFEQLYNYVKLKNNKYVGRSSICKYYEKYNNNSNFDDNFYSDYSEQLKNK